MAYSDLKKVLGGKKTLGKDIRNQLDLIELSREGVTKDALEHLAEHLSLPMSQMAELLPVSERTIQRYARKKQFSPVISEHIIKIAEVTARGEEVFGDKDKFLLWMNHPHKSFDNKTPMSLLASMLGADMVLDELGRMEHGTFS